VGKSTLAAHLAQELARRGYKVGLVDTDIYGPSIPTLFGLQNHRVQTDQNKFFIPVTKNNLKIMSFGFLLGDAPAVMRGPIVTRYVQQMLLTTAWGELDYLFIDLPPGTGDVQLTITQTVRLNGSVIVTTPQTLSLIDVARGILMFERVQVPILGLIENMAFFNCDQCDKKHYIFGGREQTQSLKTRFGIDCLAEIPILPQMTLSIEKPIANEYIMQAVDQLIRSLGKNSIAQKQIPKIKLEDKRISLEWQDGTDDHVDYRVLRLNCRCALCVNELTGEKILDEKNIKADIAPTEVFPLGNYALAISWNDGHTSGIYTYAMIKELSHPTLRKT
jgi:ATP-binding protein involved in chromosome partitioning